MKFEEKYISEKENSEKPDPSRILISSEAYAIAEMVQALIDKIELMRRPK